jgi:hypothetical protein
MQFEDVEGNTEQEEGKSMKPNELILSQFRIGCIVSHVPCGPHEATELRSQK